jgi:hypothetical protein
MDPLWIDKGKESNRNGQGQKEATMKTKTTKWQKSLVSNKTDLGKILLMLLGMTNLVESNQQIFLYAKKPHLKLHKIYSFHAKSIHHLQ